MPLCVRDDHEIFSLRLVGSAMPLHYKENYYLICSAHQIDNIDPKEVCVITPDGQSFITCSGARFLSSDLRKESDAYDIVALKFTHAVTTLEALRAEFFNFCTLPSDIDVENVIAFLVSGYPTSEQIYDVYDNNHIGLRRRVVTGTHPFISRDEAVIKARYFGGIDFRPDGLSGSPVFVVQCESGEHRAHLAGMVLRSSQEEFYFIKIGYIKNFIESFT